MQEGGPIGLSVGDCLDRFLDDLLIAGRSPLTVRLYRTKLRNVLPLDSPLYDLTTGILRALVANQVRRWQPNTAHTFYGMLRSFSKWLKAQGLTATNLADGIPAPRKPEPRIRALSAEQMTRLWQAACELDRSSSLAYDQREVDHSERAIARHTGMYPEKTDEQRSWSDSTIEETPAVHPTEGADAGEESPDSTTEAACALDSEAAPKDGCCPHEADQAPPFDHTGGRAAEHGRASNPLRRNDTTYRLLFLLLSTTGLRRAEVAGARYEDIEGDVLRVLGKGRKWRRVVLTEEMRGLLADSGRDVAVKRLAGAAQLFQSPDQMPRLPSDRSGIVTSLPPDSTMRGLILGLTSERVGVYFQRIARKAGVACSPHALRHTFFTRWVAEGRSISLGVVVGGWTSDRELTKRYAKGAIEDAALAEMRRMAGR